MGDVGRRRGRAVEHLGTCQLSLLEVDASLAVCISFYQQMRVNVFPVLSAPLDSLSLLTVDQFFQYDRLIVFQV